MSWRFTGAVAMILVSQAIAGEVLEGWGAVVGVREGARGLIDAGRYREAASRYVQLRQRTRDADVKEYARYAEALCKLRDGVGKNRPGHELLAMDFDDGGVPAAFRDGGESLSIETNLTFAGSPGALVAVAQAAGDFVLAESYSPFTVAAGGVMAICVFPHGLSEAKLQLNTSNGSVHYFWKDALKEDAWNVLLFRLSTDGSALMPVGTAVHSLGFVGTAQTPAAFAVIDEWRVIMHP